MQARDEVEHNYKWVSSWSLLCGKEMLKAGRTLLFLNLSHTWSEQIILFQQGYGCTYLVFCMLPFLLNFKALAKQLFRERKGYLFNNFNWSGQWSLIINYLGSSCHYCVKWHFFSFLFVQNYERQTGKSHERTGQWGHCCFKLWYYLAMHHWILMDRTLNYPDDG